MTRPIFMYFSQRAAAIAFALTASTAMLPGLAFAEEQPSEEHSHHAHAAASSDAAIGPFATDAPLRAGMTRVRASVAALSEFAAASTSATIDDRQVVRLTDEVNAAIQSMFAQCRLPPDADAALHPLLADLLQANSALADAPSNWEPLAKMQGVLKLYDEQFFDDANRQDDATGDDGASSHDDAASDGDASSHDHQH